MRNIWSGLLLGRGIGFFGRFGLALVIILVLKSYKKDDPQLSKGLRLLIFFGVITVIAMSLLFVLWLFMFGYTVSLPSIFGYYHY